MVHVLYPADMYLLLCDGLPALPLLYFDQFLERRKENKDKVGLWLSVKWE